MTTTRFVLLVSVALLSIVHRVHAFVSSPSPPFLGRRTRAALQAAALSPGELVVVVGGTGGVGQLVTSKLADRGMKVRATCRDKTKGESILNNPKVEVMSVDLVNDSDSIRSALADASAVVISVGTTAFPTARWKNGNNPKAIDAQAVSRIAEIAAKDCPKLKKIVLVTSVGIERTKEMPFLILNLFGVLDAKKEGEQAIIDASKKAGFDYAIIRPGRLVGGPFTNLDVAKLLQVQGGAENGVQLKAGDSLLGDCKRDGCAEAVVQALVCKECENLIFSLISTEEQALSDDQWKTAFQSM